MNQLARRYGLPARTFSSRALEACQAHSWPGNLRELENFVKRYLVMGDDEDTVLSELGQESDPWPGESPARNAGEAVESEDPTSGLRSLVQSVKGEAERTAIAAALDQTRWNRKAAARLLKVSYRTLLYKIQQYHMTPPAGHLSGYGSGNGGLRERSVYQKG